LTSGDSPVPSTTVAGTSTTTAPVVSDHPVASASTSTAATSSTTTTVVPYAQIPPLAIGDSVMLGARPQLQAAGIRVDAVESRRLGAALGLIQLHHAHHELGRVVVIALGTNGTFVTAQLQALLGELASVPHVIFVTPEVAGRPNESVNRALLLSLPARYHNVSVLDWWQAARPKLSLWWHAPGLSSVNQAYFWADRIHLAPAGRTYYASLIVGAIQRVSA
jgi:hypothetical protein